MSNQENWFERHDGLWFTIVISMIIIGAIILGVFVLAPEKAKEINELKSMDCNTIKKHLADEDFGLMLDESRFNAQYIWRCTK